MSLENITRFLGMMCSVLLCLVVGFIFFTLCKYGLENFSFKALRFLAPQILGSCAVASLSVLLATPAAIVLAILMVRKSVMQRWVHFCVMALAGIPSIGIGFLGLTAVLCLRSWSLWDANTGLFVAASALGFLILPCLTKSFEASLSLVYLQTKQKAQSLGLTEKQQFSHIYWPLARHGLFRGMALGMARAVEDTAVVMLTGATMLSVWPTHLFRPFNTLSFHIYFLASEYQSPQDVAQLFLCACLLFFLSFNTDHDLWCEDI